MRARQAEGVWIKDRISQRGVRIFNIEVVCFGQGTGNGLPVGEKEPKFVDKPLTRAASSRTLTLRYFVSRYLLHTYTFTLKVVRVATS